MGKLDSSQTKAALSLCLNLFGSPEAWVGERRLELPVKKMWGLLAYLALEGPTSRGKLVSLLWSDLDEESARRNLRLGLHRVKSKTPG